jgi:hypothetical protein
MYPLSHTPDCPIEVDHGNAGSTQNNRDLIRVFMAQEFIEHQMY